MEQQRTTDKGNFAIVENVGRRKTEGQLPPLMDDTRENFLLSAEGQEIKVYLKTVAGPYTGEHGNHFLVIPDKIDQTNIPGVKDLLPTDLGVALEMAESVAYKTLMQEGIEEVDFGFHHSRAELTGIPKQRAATFPKNLHIHITGYSGQDLKPLSLEELNSPGLKGKTKDAVHFISEQVFYNEIVKPLREENPAFESVFEEMRDSRKRLRFKMRKGREGFKDQQLSVILQEIDKRAKDSYDKLGKCFFEYDSQNNKFIEKDDQYKRFKLLTIDQRKQNIKRYIEERPWLSEGARYGLRWLAENAKDESEILQRELAKNVGATTTGRTDFRSDSAEKQAANRFWAYKDLTYTMVWSAKKGEDGTINWIFGFDPMVFTVEGLPQSSAFTDKIILKRPNEFYTPKQLAEMQVREESIVSDVVKENPIFQKGKSPSGV